MIGMTTQTIQAVTQQINSLGLVDSEIAARVSSTQPTISRIRSGEIKDPKYNLGKKLVDLLAEIKSK